MIYGDYYTTTKLQIIQERQKFNEFDSKYNNSILNKRSLMYFQNYVIYIYKIFILLLLILCVTENNKDTKHCKIEIRVAQIQNVRSSTCNFKLFNLF